VAAVEAIIDITGVSLMRHLKGGLVGLLISVSLVGVALADGINGAPPPFDKGGVKVALVSYLSQGDYFEAYEAGVARQAKALGVDLHIFQGK
jgi:simple sugar transport system substrate-binding protein